MSRILLLMTTRTYRAGAFVEAAARLGIEVAVASEEAHVLSGGNPAGHLTLDFHDLEGATDAIVGFVREHPVDALVSTDDDGVVLAAMASDALKLPHNPLNAVIAARDKFQTREALAAAGMRVPAYRRFSVRDDASQVAQEVSYPCVVKPLALSASRGVMRADQPAALIEAFERLVSILSGTEFDVVSDAAQHILVEDFIPGVEVAVEGVLVKGQLVVLALFDKPDPLDGPYFEETIYVTPSRHPPDVQEAIVAETQQAVRALGLTSGPVHAELRLNASGPWMLEVAPRSIGGYCSRALRFGLTTTLEDVILEHALGRKLPSTEPATPASGVMMIPIPKGGMLCEVHGLAAAQAVPGVDEVRLTISIGQTVVPLPEGSQYLGFIFARGETAAYVEAALREAHAHLNFVIMPPDEMPA